MDKNEFTIFKAQEQRKNLNIFYQASIDSVAKLINDAKENPYLIEKIKNDIDKAYESYLQLRILNDMIGDEE